MATHVYMPKKKCGIKPSQHAITLSDIAQTDCRTKHVNSELN